MANGRCLVWDFTCPDTLAASHLNRAVVSPGSVANDAEDRKTTKYRAIGTALQFHAHRRRITWTSGWLCNWFYFKSLVSEFPWQLESRGHPSSFSKDSALPSRGGMLHAWLELYRVHLDLRTSFTLVLDFVVFVLINLFEEPFNTRIQTLTCPMTSWFYN